MPKLAIIPARGGSKRIPNKNIKDFFGKPIIAYPIETALKSGLFEDVIVSTDSDEIARISRQFGASVPFMRSKINSNDFATLADVLFEVVQNYLEKGQKFNAICCILPTSVLIRSNHLIDSYNKFKEKGFSSLVPVIKFAYPIQRALKEKNDLLVMREPIHLLSRSQDLETYYHDSGQFYWINSDDLLLGKTIFTDNTGYFEIQETDAQDIDSMIDWKMLTIKYKYLNTKK